MGNKNGFKISKFFCFFNVAARQMVCRAAQMRKNKELILTQQYTDAQKAQERADRVKKGFFVKYFRLLLGCKKRETLKSVSFLTRLSL